MLFNLYYVLSIFLRCKFQICRGKTDKFNKESRQVKPLTKIDQCIFFFLFLVLFINRFKNKIISIKIQFEDSSNLSIWKRGTQSTHLKAVHGFQERCAQLGVGHHVVKLGEARDFVTGRTWGDRRENSDVTSQENTTFSPLLLGATFSTGIEMWFIATCAILTLIIPMTFPTTVSSC